MDGGVCAGGRRKKGADGGQPPQYRARHRVEGDELLLSRDSAGYWAVRRTAEGEPIMKSSTAGAMVPLHLRWQIWRGGHWQAAAELTVTALRSKDA